MFHLTYVARELRRRLGRTILTALGLALGVGLVIGIIGVSQGLDDAQDEVLAPLQSVGTDILVTRVAGATTTDAAATNNDTTTTTVQGRGGFFMGGPGGGGRNAAINIEDVRALEQENSNVTTDLSKLGKPGEQFTHDFFLSATLLSFPADALDQIKKVDGVSSAAGGLTQLAQHQTGTVPNIVAEIQTGGETVEQEITPPTEAEQKAIQECLAQRGIQGPQRVESGGGSDVVVAQPAPDGGPGGGAGACFPERFRRARINTPMRTIQQVVNPPQTNITNTSYTAAGVDVANKDVGLVTAEQLTDGKWLSGNTANEVLVNVAYANTKKLKVGDKIPINGADYTVVGLVRPTLTGSTADLYFPLTKLQELSSKQNRITSVLVKAKDAESVDKVAAEIKKILPGAEVVTTKALADQVTGSLASANKLANRLGGALAVIVLVAAFAIAALLTLSSIAKRVREIGTLRAIGWSKGRVVRQLLGETMGIGVVGGVIGLGVGAVVAALISMASPELSATTSGVPGLNGSQLSQFFNQAASTAQTTTVKLSAPISPTTLALGLAFALVGGLLAGLIGSWRAARLAPSVALRDLG